MTYESHTLIDNGDPANRVDLVFVGDGYRAGDIRADYHIMVERVVEAMFGEAPLSTYQRYFNVHVVDVVSNDRGSDHPDRGVFRDTALDTVFGIGGTRCLYTTSPHKVLDAAAQAPAPADVILILVNDEEYGGCGLQFAVAAGLDPNVMVHEFGHTFAVLGDEYGGGGRYSGANPRNPNLTSETALERIPWRLWIPAGTQLPTLDPEEGLPAGLYEGGGFFDFGIFRPTYDSKMRTIGLPWGAVNGEALVKRVYSIVDPLDVSSPAEEVIDFEDGLPRIFSVSPPDPSLPSVRVQWVLDGVLISEEGRIEISADTVPPGAARILTVAVRDDTEDVRDRTSGPPLKSTKAWTLHKGPTSSPSATGTPTATPSSSPTVPAPSATPTATLQAPVAATTQSATPTPTPTLSQPPRTQSATPAARCACDCNADDVVTIDELILSLRLALEGGGHERCRLADPNNDGLTSIDELVRGVGSALSGCVA